MQLNEFSVKTHRKDAETLTIRLREMSPVELLGLEEIINTKDIERATYMFECILDRLEIKLGTIWVKLKDGPVYTPEWLGTDVATLYKICTQFLVQVFIPVFQKSEESKK